MSTVLIRSYATSDAAAVSDVIRTTIRVSNAADYSAEMLQPLINYFTPAKVQQLSQERACLVAEQAGKLVGTAALDADKVVTFFVHPNYQGIGVGSALLAALEAAAKARQQVQLTVEASLTGVGFYERRGYRRCGDELIGTAIPRVPMGKELGNAVDTRD